jgi:hypothetical protein
MIASFLKDISQPEYIHVLINPLPVYGLAMGVIGLIIALTQRSRPAQVRPFRDLAQRRDYLAGHLR